MYLSYVRKSTRGLSINSFWGDFFGGTLSECQIVFDWMLTGEGGFWEELNITKFLLGLVTISYDIICFFQHYVLYKTPKKKQDTAKPETATNLEEIISKGTLPQTIDLDMQNKQNDNSKWSIKQYIDKKKPNKELDEENISERNSKNATQEFDVAKYALPKTPKDSEGETTDYESISEKNNKKVPEELRNSKFALPKSSNREQTNYEKVDQKNEKVTTDIAETQKEKQIDGSLEDKQIDITIEEKHFDNKIEEKQIDSTIEEKHFDNNIEEGQIDSKIEQKQIESN